MTEAYKKRQCVAIAKDGARCRNWALIELSEVHKKLCRAHSKRKKEKK